MDANETIFNLGLSYAVEPDVEERGQFIFREKRFEFGTRGVQAEGVTGGISVAIERLQRAERQRDDGCADAGVVGVFGGDGGDDEVVGVVAAGEEDAHERLVNPRRAWAGLYEMTPDHHSIIGPAPGVEGLFFVNGFSGHGVMHSPAAGRVTADVILGGSSDLIDVSQLSVERFASGKLLEETAVL